jgi:hypothetical protein
MAWYLVHPKQGVVVRRDAQGVTLPSEEDARALGVDVAAALDLGGGEGRAAPVAADAPAAAALRGGRPARALRRARRGGLHGRPAARDARPSSGRRRAATAAAAARATERVDHERSCSCAAALLAHAAVTIVLNALGVSGAKDATAAADYGESLSQQRAIHELHDHADDALAGDEARGDRHDEAIGLAAVGAPERPRRERTDQERERDVEGQQQAEPQARRRRQPPGVPGQRPLGDGEQHARQQTGGDPVARHRMQVGEPEPEDVGDCATNCRRGCAPSRWPDLRSLSRSALARPVLALMLAVIRLAA